MSILKILDCTDDGYLAFDLAEVLSVLGGDFPAFTWKIEFLEAVAKPDRGLDVLELERRIKSSKGGMVIEWTELCSVADNLLQTINCRITCEDIISVEAVDSSYWLVSCKMPEVLRRFRNHFKKVLEVAE